MRSDDLIADRYRLVEQIGAGGMGTVWLAFDELERRQVALKSPIPSRVADIKAELEREARIARRVVHPNAIEIYGVVGNAEDCWLAMEYFRSENLASVLDRRGPPPPLEAAAIGVQVASALVAAHAANVVHRDVTPGNILLAEDGTAKVADYGISVWRAATVISNGNLNGTMAYVSPEVANGEGAKKPADVFSLGATLYAAVEGGPPFGAGHPAAILTRIRDNHMEPMRNAGPLLPVLSALLHRDPGLRPTAEQAREMLARVADGQTVPAWEPPTAGRRRRHVLLTSVAAVAVVGIAAAVIIQPWQRETQSGPARSQVVDIRTADLCALADADVFDRFGDAHIDQDYGEFNRCDVLIDVPEGGLVDVAFMWQEPGFSLGRRPDHSGVSGSDTRLTDRDDNACDIPITLTGAYWVMNIVVTTDGPVKVDLCEVAGVAADHVVAAFAAMGEVPRLPDRDGRSLALRGSVRTVLSRQRGGRAQLRVRALQFR